MPKRSDIKNILVIGSGPIIIGQAAEFDYSGTQACQSLREEGYSVILVNSNPATIMTDTETADKVYIEPLTVETLTEIIRKERPDAILPTLGGQTGLNMAVELAKSGVLDECGVEILGTKLSSIEKAEDRDLFRQLMYEIGEPVPESEIIYTLEEARAFVERIGFPVIVRPAFTLGGTGGGICANDEELEEIVASGLKNSPVHQCLLEKSIAGYKEIEYEVMRDAGNHAIVVCNMENIDPVGIHTGDSIVVAPSQTLSDREYQMLRNVSLKIIRALEIEGGCNVQLALDPYSMKYYIIEVNPRVSRSSALASKATGYPIAKLAAKIAVGLTLDEIENPVTKKTFASFEPALDYVVSKIPRWPFDKFQKGNRRLGTQMKATGEVMAIGRTLEESLLKAVRSLEYGVHHLQLKNFPKMDKETFKEKLIKADDERIFVVSEAIRQGISIEEIHEWTKIDLFFLNKFKNIIDLEKEIASSPMNLEVLAKAKKLGYSDKYIAEAWNQTEYEIYQLRKQEHLIPVYKMVDTCAGEFEAFTPYYYGTYETEDESVVTDKKSVVVLGSGPIRIGQGVEFDYATVHAVWAIKEAGYEAIIINNNPETVSTDFTISDKLYFEPLTIEDVMHVIDHEKPEGVLVQFGGQTAINLAEKLVERGVKILGTSLEALNRAEDRKQFEAALSKLGIPQPLGKTATNVEEAVAIAKEIGFPVLVRPSFVLGGRAMEIVENETELIYYMENAVQASPEHPILVDRYLTGMEIEVDAISDGETVFIPGIMEHIERAGVHSGDSIAVYPPQNIPEETKKQIVDYTIRLAKGLEIVGLLNIQFVISNGEAYVLEVNPRSSRTIPFLSKITCVPMANIATKIMLGKTLKELGFCTGYKKEREGVYIKAPVFSFAKLGDVDITLGPEMKSTGEVMGKDVSLEKALYKALVASGIQIPTFGTVVLTVADKDKKEIIEIARRFKAIGYHVVATAGTQKYLAEHKIEVDKVGKIADENQTSLIDMIHTGEAQYIINTLTKGKQPMRDGYQIRRSAVENGVACLTSLDTANAILSVLEMMKFSAEVMEAKMEHEVIYS